MTTCPQGHVSNDPDWCDTCGAPIGSTASPSASNPTGTAPSAAPSGSSGSSGLSGSSGSVSPSVIDPSGASAGTNAAASTGPATINCPSCGDTNPEANLFCESCGLDFVTGQVPPPPIAAPAAIADPQLINGLDPMHDPGTDLGWEVVLTVDTEWFAAKGEGIGTPPTRSERVEELRHSPLVIGRTRSSGKNPGIVIDDDHGISRRHAELTLDAATNTWTITDLGSTNGTFLIGADIVLDASLTPLTPNTPVAVMPTDRIFVGAWTRVTLQPLQPLQPLDPLQPHDPHVKP